MESQLQDVDFVTVVSVGNTEITRVEQVAESFTTDTSFVTVLSIGDDKVQSSVSNGVNIEVNEPPPETPGEVTLIESVNVYRLPGERLGFGLKFEGGTKSSEFVKRLFIQSCAADSPASRVVASWGCLGEGDEIIAIDNKSVEKMTRIDCVRCLKDSPVVIELCVKRKTTQEGLKIIEGKEDVPSVISAEKKRLPPPPPPIPPRKIPKRIQTKTSNVVVPPKDFVDEIPKPTVRKSLSNEMKDADDDKNKSIKRLPSPRGIQRSVTPRQNAPRDRRASDGSLNPPDAEFYINLLSQERETFRAESESDDTGSSISTVVDKLGSFPTTSNSSFSESRSVENSVPSTPTFATKNIDLAKVLGPFEVLEKEFATRLSEDLLSVNSTSEERISDISIKLVDDDNLMLQPPLNFQDAPLSYANENVISINNNNILIQSNEKYVDDNIEDEVFKLNLLNGADSKTYENVEISENNKENHVTVIQTSTLSKAVEKTEETKQVKTPPKPLPRNLTSQHVSRIPKRRAPPPPPPRNIVKQKVEVDVDDDLPDSKFNTIEHWLQEAEKNIKRDYVAQGVIYDIDKPIKKIVEEMPSKQNTNESKKPKLKLKDESNLPRLIDFVPKVSPLNTPVLDVSDPLERIDSIQNPADDLEDDILLDENETSIIKETILSTSNYNKFTDNPIKNNNNISEIFENENNTNINTINELEMEERFTEPFFISKNYYEENRHNSMFKSDESKNESDGSTGSSDDEVIADLPDGPSEAYFTYWGGSHLPTIGEDEEEYSSLENQAKGPIVIIDGVDEADTIPIQNKLTPPETKSEEIPEDNFKIINENIITPQEQEDDVIDSNEVRNPPDGTPTPTTSTLETNESLLKQQEDCQKNVKNIVGVQKGDQNLLCVLQEIQNETKINIVCDLKHNSDVDINSGNENDSVIGYVSHSTSQSDSDNVVVSDSIVENTFESEITNSKVDSVELDNTIIDKCIVVQSIDSCENNIVTEGQGQDSSAVSVDNMNIKIDQVCERNDFGQSVVVSEVIGDVRAVPGVGCDDLYAVVKMEADGESDESVTNKSRQTEPVTSKSAPLGNDHVSVPVALPRAAESAATHSPKLIGVDGIMEPLVPQQPPPPLPPTSTYPVGSPPPSSSRLPPDGHEFPVNYIEPISQNIDSTNYNSNKVDNAMFESKMFIQTESLKTPPPLPKSVPPPVLPRLNTFNDSNIIEQKESTHARRLSTSSVKESTRPSWVKDDVDDKRSTRKISTSSIDDKFHKSSWSKLSDEDKPRSWRKDVKSECSVRDKIAMFSNSPSTELDAPLFPTPTAPSPATRRLSKTFKSSEDVFNSLDESDAPISTTRRYSKSSLSIDKLGLTIDHASTYGGHDNTPTYPINKTEIKMETKAATDVDTTNRRFSSTLEMRPRLMSTTESGRDREFYSGSSSTLPRKTSALPDKTYQSPQVLSRAMSFSGSPYVGIHNRSQSLSDVGTNKLQSETERKNNLNNLIEQRRKSMSKLRGLVIPERVVELPSLPSITDLPEIRSRDSILNNKPPIIMKTSNSVSSTLNAKPSQLVTPPPWKIQENNNSNLPKYSPAFKRKSLQVYADTTTSSSPLSSSREDMSSEHSNGHSEHPSNGNGYDKDYRRTPIKPPRTSLNNHSYRPNQHPGNSDSPKSLESLISPRSDISFDFIDSKSDGKPIPKMRMDLNTRIEEDSDNDSAVSSSQSSYVSRGYSPPSSPVQNLRSHSLISPCPSVTSSDDRQNNEVNIERQPLRRTLSSETNTSVASSTTSTLTSGSQASCSSVGSSNYDSRRVLKPQSVEAINRKNILASAKCRSGKDLKGSPLIQRKFDEDSTDGNEDAPPSYPKYKPKSASKLITNNGGPEPVHYKVAEDSIVDSVLNVAYIEVDDSQNSDIFCTEPSSLEFTLTPPPSADDTKTAASLPEMEASDSDTDIRKWVRNEAKYVTQKATERITKSEELAKKIDKSNEEVNHLITAVPRRLSGNKSIDNENEENNDLLNLLNKSEFRRSNSRDLLSNRPTSLALNRINGSESKKDDVKQSITVNKYDQIVKSIKNDSFTKDKRSTSVNDIRKTFEKTPPPTNLTISIRNSANKSVNGSLNNVSQANHGRMSSLDSTTSEGSSGVSSMMTTSQNNNSGSSNNLQSGDFGSISSLASTTSIISQQELQQLIDEANQAGEDSSPPCLVSLNDAVVIVLHRETPGSSIGITLAGGVDYETKEITVHKVLIGSPAERDGRLQKGDRILSINGKSMKGVTHKESLAILKTPRPEVVLVTSRSRPQSQPATPTTKTPRKSHHQLSQSLDNTLETRSSTNVITSIPTTTNTNVSVTLLKDGAGLGFSLEGGQDSPLGDKPLTIKKIFTGGAAEKCGQLHAGDELLKVNDTLVTSLTRVEAWSIMKKLADGAVEITVRR